MKIAGLQKMTLLDYPGKVACTVFLPGCNFRCPFCHNGELLDARAPILMEDSELLSFLKTRRGILDAVCISGGEPTLHSGLEDLLRAIQDLGFLTKLDTNGSHPALLKHLVISGLLDYVAMDIKNSPARYAETVGLDAMDLSVIEESIRFLLTGEVDYEFRTTVVSQLHDENSVREMGEWVNSLGEGAKAKRFFLQPFTDRDTVLFSGLSAPEAEKLAGYAQQLAPFMESVSIRG